MVEIEAESRANISSKDDFLLRVGEGKSIFIRGRLGMGVGAAATAAFASSGALCLAKKLVVLLEVVFCG
jgi:hypothetical protein